MRVISFLPLCESQGSQVVKLGCKCLYTLSHLAGPGLKKLLASPGVDLFLCSPLLSSSDMLTSSALVPSHTYTGEHSPGLSCLQERSFLTLTGSSLGMPVAVSCFCSGVLSSGCQRFTGREFTSYLPSGQKT